METALHRCAVVPTQSTNSRVAYTIHTYICTVANGEFGRKKIQIISHFAIHILYLMRSNYLVILILTIGPRENPYIL